MRSAAIQLTRFGSGASTGLASDAEGRPAARDPGLLEVAVFVGL